MIRYRVSKKGKGWQVQREGAAKATGTYQTQAEAAQAARALLSGRAGSVIVHGSDGAVISAQDFDEAAEQAIKDDFWLLVDATIADFPPEIREVVLMRLQSELSVEEVADLTGVSVGTVRVRYQKGIARLRAALAAQGLEADPVERAFAAIPASPLRITVQPATASDEEIADILARLSNLYRKFGGSGITFELQGVEEVPDGEGVL